MNLPSKTISSPDILSHTVTKSQSTVSRKVTFLLKAAATSWFVVAALGQLIFAAYVSGFYGRPAARGEFEAWNKVLPHGYVPGDTTANVVLALHLFFAVIITVGGVLQLLPKLRQWAPALHRWNGRVYLSTALVMSIGGLFMVWSRSNIGGIWQHVAISMNALLIIYCAFMTYRYARARRIDLHRQWALRLFMVVSGVWFFRIGLMLWIVVNQGPVGFDPDTFQGPALDILAFSAYVVMPLLILELYLRAQKSQANWPHVAMAVSLVILALLTAAGVASATMIVWLPRLA